MAVSDMHYTTATRRRHLQRTHRLLSLETDNQGSRQVDGAANTAEAIERFEIDTEERKTWAPQERNPAFGSASSREEEGVFLVEDR